MVYVLCFKSINIYNIELQHHSLVASYSLFCSFITELEVNIMSNKGNKASAAVQVIRDMRQLDIKDPSSSAESPSKQQHKDAAAALADKYQVDLDTSGDSLKYVGGEIDEARVMESILQNQDLVARTDALVRRLDDKNREVDRLCTLLEGVTMVPGIDPDRLLNIYDGIAEEPIVSIAFTTKLLS